MLAQNAYRLVLALTILLASLMPAVAQPPAGATLLLVAHQPSRLLPTIRSRCAVFAMRGLGDDEVASVVRDQQPDWLQVQINQRPNGATCWIKASDVALRTVPNHILIERGAKRLSVFHGEEQLMSTSVAPGRESSPTPLGAFYVDILTRPTNPNGPYGPFQVSVTGFSEVYESFGGGNGQIAVHGTNRPELIGTPASHGCVRMTNEDITALIPLARQGTPVVIVA